MTTRTDDCHHCGRAFTQERKAGKPRAYCSDACRVARTAADKAALKAQAKARAEVARSGPSGRARVVQASVQRAILRQRGAATRTQLFEQIDRLIERADTQRAETRRRMRHHDMTAATDEAHRLVTTLEETLATAVHIWHLCQSEASRVA